MVGTLERGVIRVPEGRTPIVSNKGGGRIRGVLTFLQNISKWKPETNGGERAFGDPNWKSKHMPHNR